MSSDKSMSATYRASFLDGKHRPIRVEAESRDEAIEKARDQAGCMVASVSEVE